MTPKTLYKKDQLSVINHDDKRGAPVYRVRIMQIGGSGADTRQPASVLYGVDNPLQRGFVFGSLVCLVVALGKWAGRLR